jgi:isopenicillin N synthase-like dioxygenase
MASLPIIDISPFLDPESSSASRLETARALDHACRAVGFFYLSGSNVSTAEQLEILSLARSFFSLPSEEKEKLRLRPAGVLDGDGARGYQMMGENITLGKRDWHEGLDFYRPVPDVKPPFSLIMGDNKWPSGDFRKIYQAYIEKLLVLGKAVMRAMALGLGEPEDRFDTLIHESFWVLRAIGYPPLQSEANGGISCGEHTGTGPTSSLTNLRLWMFNVFECGCTCEGIIASQVASNRRMDFCRPNRRMFCL